MKEGNKDNGVPQQKCGRCFTLGKHENIIIKPIMLYINSRQINVQL